MTEYNAPTAARSLPHPLPEGVEGVRRLIRAARNEQAKTLIAFIGFCGLRVSEALSVQPEDFNFTEMTLLVHGKGDRDRVVPVSPEAWAVLEERVLHAFAFREPIISYKDRFARKIITDTGRKAGLMREISSHDLRATFGTEVQARTGDIRITQELLGHASIASTQIYTAVSMDQMRKAACFT